MPHPTTCPRCAAAVAPADQFCASCGLSLTSAANDRLELAERTRAVRHRREMQLLGVAAIIVLVLLWYVSTH